MLILYRPWTKRIYVARSLESCRREECFNHWRALIDHLEKGTEEGILVLSWASRHISERGGHQVDFPMVGRVLNYVHVIFYSLFLALDGPYPIEDLVMACHWAVNASIVYLPSCRVTYFTVECSNLLVFEVLEQI